MSSLDAADDERDEILAMPVTRSRWSGRRQVELIPVLEIVQRPGPMGRPACRRRNRISVAVPFRARTVLGQTDK
jgi:hypothetical protein